MRYAMLCSQLRLLDRFGVQAWGLRYLQDQAVSRAVQTVVAFDASDGALESTFAWGNQTSAETVNANVMSQAAISDRAFMKSLTGKYWHRWIPLPS